MFHVILVQPEIPPNTGNVIRLCANTGARLHLVKPLGFTVDDAKLRRAGLDYHDWQPIAQHDSLEQAVTAIGTRAERVFAITTKGTRHAGEVAYQPGDVFVFGGVGIGKLRLNDIWRCSLRSGLCSEITPMGWLPQRRRGMMFSLEYPRTCNTDCRLENFCV